MLQVYANALILSVDINTNMPGDLADSHG